MDIGHIILGTSLVKYAVKSELSFERYLPCLRVDVLSVWHHYRRTVVLVLFIILYLNMVILFEPIKRNSDIDPK